ncbi:MAG: type II toxin-antitoxin system RelB/DinJ family antitoxin [Oscillospiraceae bacterium]
MATNPTQIRIDAELKQQATELFSNLGLDMSGAVTLFLRQCILHNGLPFKVEMPKYSKQLLSAIDEAKEISRNPDVKSYTNMEDLKAALDEDV